MMKFNFLNKFFNSVSLCLRMLFYKTLRLPIEIFVPQINSNLIITASDADFFRGKVFSKSGCVNIPCVTRFRHLTVILTCEWRISLFMNEEISNIFLWKNTILQVLSFFPPSFSLCNGRFINRTSCFTFQLRMR